MVRRSKRLKRIVESDSEDDVPLTELKKGRFETDGVFVPSETSSLNGFIVQDEEPFKSRWIEDEDYSIPTNDKVHKYETIVKGMVLPEEIKERVLGMISNFEEMDMPGAPNDGEKFKLKKFLDNFTKIPFGKYAGESVGRDDTLTRKRDFLVKIKENMDRHIFGQKCAKNTILEVIAKRINSPDGNGNIIALSGPPGVGKTSLIRNGLSRAYDVPFNFISLGGARHVNTLRGSDYSYIGSGWGKIVDILIKSQCMDPIIFFDELDKISTSDDGLDIVSSLVHLTDPSQNSEWEDLYFSGIPFDLSRATIIFSLNDESMIPEPLLDRLTVVKMRGFNEIEKVEIARKYCIPRLCHDIGFGSREIIIGDDAIRTIIKHYCKEEGVRMLEKCLRIIMMKFNYFHMIELGKEEYGKDNPYKIDPATAKIILDPVLI